MTRQEPGWLTVGELAELAGVLANAFAPRWLPPRGRWLIRLPFSLILIAAQSWGALVYIPGRAVAVLTPPRRRPRAIPNKVTRLGHTHWRLSNCAAWPTGKGSGTILLGQICGLADAAGIDLCLRASNSANQKFYRRLGFAFASPNWRGMTMTRQCERRPGISAERGEARLSGRFAAAFGRPA